MQTHRGSCHCGRITFEFDGEVGVAIECNCSICRRKGALWYGTDDAHFRLLAPASWLVQEAKAMAANPLGSGSLPVFAIPATCCWAEPPTCGNTMTSYY